MLDKIADYLNTTPQTVVITLVVLAVLFVIIWIKISMDEKKGVDSQEKWTSENYLMRLGRMCSFFL